MALLLEGRAIPACWRGTISASEPQVKSLCSAKYEVLHGPDVAHNNDNQNLAGGIQFYMA